MYLYVLLSVTRLETTMNYLPFLIIVWALHYMWMTLWTPVYLICLCVLSVASIILFLIPATRTPLSLAHGALAYQWLLILLLPYPGLHLVAAFVLYGTSCYRTLRYC